MKTIAISEFKSRALQVVGRVAKTKKPVIVTRRGEPVAKVVPFSGADDKPIPGKLAETLVFEKDIVSPLGESVWKGRTGDSPDDHGRDCSFGARRLRKDAEVRR